MDGAGSHYQQTVAGTENETLHVLTYKWELNSENTWRGNNPPCSLSEGGGWEEGKNQKEFLMNAMLNT